MKTDCWSFGCILFALVTGKPPFESSTIQETLKKVKSKNQMDIPMTLSAQLQDLLKHTINWNEDDRYDIEKILSHPFFTLQDQLPQNKQSEAALTQATLNAKNIPLTSKDGLLKPREETKCSTFANYINN